MSKHQQSPTDFAKSQVVEMDQLLGLAGDHPVMGPALRQLKAEYEEDLRHLPVEAVIPTPPQTVLYFSGGPVVGSEGIDAGFASQILSPFLEMVKTQYATTKHGRVGARGPRKSETQARLLLTDLPRGSFGLELSQPTPDDLFSGMQLTKVLRDLTGVIGAAGETEESFAKSLSEVSPRVLPRLKDFFQIVVDAKAELLIVTGTTRSRLTTPQLEKASELVLVVTSVETEERLPGVFRGATLDSWRFDFRANTGENIAGRLSADMSDEKAANLPPVNTHCSATLLKTTVATRNVTSSTRYELVDISPLDNAPDASNSGASDEEIIRPGEEI